LVSNSPTDIYPLGFIDIGVILRVLIAHNDPDFLGSLQCQLDARGYSADVAVDGVQCASILKRVSPAIVVLDANLRWGGADGVAAIMQSEPRFRKTPILVVSDPSVTHEPTPGTMVFQTMREPLRVADLAELIVILTSHQNAIQSDAPTQPRSVKSVRGSAKVAALSDRYLFFPKQKTRPSTQDP
jgi:DNA-binding response OmpR family regulator